jgi:two-component system, OmpR family, sensor histidine kinase BaeS
MLRSITFKWIATLLLTSLVGVVLVGILAYRATVTEYDRLRLEQAQTAFIEDVTGYYQANGSWDGVETWLRDKEVSPGNRFGPPQLFALANQAGQVVAGFGPIQTDELMTADELKPGIPIVIDGEQVGTALLAMPPPELDPREQRYLTSTNQALLVGAIGASAAALFIGILLSRRFLRPLAELTKAITAMKQGDLDQQVEVRTRDELGDLARTFNQMSAQIHHANQLREQMTADIAHDLRTPLMVITGYIEAMRDGTLQPTPERFEAMNQEAVLLKRLVEDLRTLSLADAGELKLVYQAAQPGELLEQIKHAFEPMANEQQVSLRVEAGEHLSPIQIDRERMLQVLANLVSNALRYTPAGGSVTLEAHQKQNDLQLVIRDTGMGIPQDKLPNIFERFYRIEESRHESNGESGLGLAIAKSIVEAHQGTIAAESQLGVGTSMTITLRPTTVAPAV